MYEDLFQTPDRPFRATPDIRFYFPYDSMEQTRQTVLRVTRRAEGPAAVMGSTGLGKTMLAQLLTSDLQERFDVVRLHAARLCSRRAMLQNILFELKLPYRDLSEGELRLSLMERMEPAPAHAADGLVLIVDEAQTLPTKLLEELRLITNFARQGQARARLVLIGSMQLEETLALPEMSSFNQRLAARCFLQPMNRAQTADFVRHQFTCAQVDPRQIITRDALENVYVASEGIPRLANQVMDHALILAIANDQYPISAALIQEAWADLQQLPMSWNQPEANSGAPVEFGSIDDLDQDFELEPEGMDEVDSPMQSHMHWPSSGDLEDFGPSSDFTGNPAQSSQGYMQGQGYMQDQAYMQTIDFETNSGIDSSERNGTTENASLPRVVFDASAMFKDRSKSPEQMSYSPTAYSRSAGMNHQAYPSMDTGDQDLFVFQEDQDSMAAPSSSSSNMFAAWTSAPPAYDVDVTSASSNFDSASHADIKPYFDAMEPMAIPMPLARVQEPMAAADPFGNDFDEEFVVDAADVQRWQENERKRKQTQAASRSADNAAARTAQTAMPAASTQKPVTQSKQAATTARTMAVESLVVTPTIQPDYAASYGSDFVAMTGSGMTGGNVDEQLQQEIEDMISQLNFSAFSVEMDSVEEISPDYLRKAAVGNQELDSDMPATVPMHRDDRNSSEQPVSSHSMDDDRDMLIIEEEVPASMRHQSTASMAPTVETVSYPQLFQQLRG